MTAAMHERSKHDCFSPFYDRRLRTQHRTCQAPNSDGIKSRENAKLEERLRSAAHAHRANTREWVCAREGVCSRGASCVVDEGVINY